MKYNIIYADPPWFYSPRNNNSKFGLGANQYKLMKDKDIIALDIGSIVDKNCACFLWVTMPKLQEGLACLKSWGFYYKTVAFTWIKTNKKNNNPYFGVGYYTKSNAELCLLGIKGRMKPITNKISSIIISPIQAHSKKPIEVEKKISALFGDIPSVELFSRREGIVKPNWKYTGLEWDGKDIRDFLNENKTQTINV